MSDQIKRRDILKWTTPVITACVLPVHAQTSAPFEPPRTPNPPLGSPPLSCEEQIQQAFENYQRINSDPSSTPEQVSQALQNWLESKQCRADEQVAVCNESDGPLTLSKTLSPQSEGPVSCPEGKS